MPEGREPQVGQIVDHYFLCFDLIPQPSGGFVRAAVTPGFFARIRGAVLAANAARRPRVVRRDESDRTG
jgi:hypothetical protein